MDAQIEKLLEMAKQYPDLEIVCMVNYEVCASDECTWWLSHIYKIGKDVIWFDKDHERVWIGEDEIKDEMSCQEIGYDGCTDDTETITDSEYEKRKQSGEIFEAIIAYIDV